VFSWPPARAYAQRVGPVTGTPRPPAETAAAGALARSLLAPPTSNAHPSHHLASELPPPTNILGALPLYSHAPPFHATAKPFTPQPSPPRHPHRPPLRVFNRALAVSCSMTEAHRPDRLVPAWILAAPQPDRPAQHQPTVAFCDAYAITRPAPPNPCAHLTPSTNIPRNPHQSRCLPSTPPRPPRPAPPACLISGTDDCFLPEEATRVTPTASHRLAPNRLRLPAHLPSPPGSPHRAHSSPSSPDPASAIAVISRPPPTALPPPANPTNPP